jgi:shikimate dehydrogenase
VQRHATWAREHGVELRAGAVDASFDIVVNATSASLHGAATLPLPASALRSGSLAVDLMYGPEAAPFVAWAASHGAVGRDGLGMLVEQAAEAFHFWRGVRPPTAPVLAELREQWR